MLVIESTETEGQEVLTRMSKALAAFLVLPFLLLLGVSPAAQAAPVYGPAHTAKVSFDLDQDGIFSGGSRELNCIVNAYYVTDSHGYFVGGRIACDYKDRSWELGPSKGTTTVTFKGAGVSTGWSTTTWEPNESFSTSFPGPQSLSTSITEVCVSGDYQRDNTWSPDMHFSGSGCAALDMGAPGQVAEDPTECVMGSVEQPIIHGDPVWGPHPNETGGSGDRNFYAWWQEVEISVTSLDPETEWFPYAVVEATDPERTSPPAGAAWGIGDHAGIHTTVGTSPDGALLWTALADVGSQWHTPPGRITGSGTKRFFVQLSAKTSWPTPEPGDPWEPPDPIGQVGELHGLGAFVIYRNSFGTAPTIQAGVLTEATTPSDSGRKAGLTHGGLCAFYWGEPVADRPDDDYAVPVGDPLREGGMPPGTPEPPVLDPVPDPEPECEFSLSDPSSWLSGGMCSLVGLFAKALQVLGQILGAIAGLPVALLEGLVGLFVPSDGFIEGKINDLSDAFDNTTVGNYLGAVTDISVPSASGCQGPAVTINPFGSGPGAQYPMSACDGAMASAATMSRLILGISVGLGGGLVCLRILGRAFGWDPVIGGRE